MQHGDGAGEPWRRGHHTGTILGKLPADGTAGWRTTRHRRGWLRPEFQDDCPAAGRSHYSKDTPHHTLLAQQPTGSVYNKEELEALANVIKRHDDLFVLADEIYEHINYVGRHESIAQYEGMKERSIIVNGVSKAYAMTGWRIGYIAAPEWIVKGCNKLQGQYTSGPCSVSQKAAEFAYTQSQECVEEMRKAFERRRDLIVKLAKDIPGLEVNVPEGAFYLFPKCSSFYGKKTPDGTPVNNSTDLAMYLLEKGHVATVGGDAFGDPDCFRMSYATSDENIVEAMRRIKEVLSVLK